MKQAKCRTSTPYPFITDVRSKKIRQGIIQTLKQIKNKLNKTRKSKNKKNKKKKKVRYNSAVNKVYNNDLY
jgi:hypothetical protein